jgi:hypothetical protein
VPGNSATTRTGEGTTPRALGKIIATSWATIACAARKHTNNATARQKLLSATMSLQLWIAPKVLLFRLAKQGYFRAFPQENCHEAILARI